MKRSILFITVVCLLGISCNKTPMKGDLEVFVGTWEWEKTYWPLPGSPDFDSLSAADQPYQYRMKITHKGEMFWYKDGVEVRKINLKIPSESCDGSCSCAVHMKENGSVSNMHYWNCGDGEYLKLDDSGFPYDYPTFNEGNIFVRLE